MENKRKALGRGLEQLFSNERIDFENFENEIIETAKGEGSIKEIKISEIRSNPYQPRKVFDEKPLQELSESIKSHGIIQPIIVKKSIKGYELIAGERRTRASSLAGMETIPAIIKDYDDQEMMEIALIENIQRENLNPIEEATAYEKIIEATNMTQEQIAQKFGKSRSYITNSLGLLRLPEKVKNLVSSGQLSMGHARSLSKLENLEKIEEFTNKIIQEHLSVRATENLVSPDEIEKKMPIRKLINNRKYPIYENIMREKIGSKVKINNSKIEIPFDSEKDLERILEILAIEIGD